VHWRDGYCYAFNVWLIYDGISRIVIYILRFCLYAAFCCRLIALKEVYAPFALINVRLREQGQTLKKSENGRKKYRNVTRKMKIIKCINRYY